jgi:hypothetical protein
METIFPFRPAGTEATFGEQCPRVFLEKTSIALLLEQFPETLRVFAVATCRIVQRADFFRSLLGTRRRAREAFRDWLRSIGLEEEEFEDYGDKSVYLIGAYEYPEDREEILRESSSAIFYEEMSARHLASEQYPDFNDFTLFAAWFETEFFDMVSDALDEPLTKSK